MTFKISDYLVIQTTNSMQGLNEMFFIRVISYSLPYRKQDSQEVGFGI